MVLVLRHSVGNRSKTFELLSVHSFFLHLGEWGGLEFEYSFFFGFALIGVRTTGRPFLKTPEKCSGFRAGEIFLIYLCNFSYKLTHCVSPSCKVINVLTFKIAKNRISDNEHCTRKIVFRARNSLGTFEKRTPDPGD